MITQEPTDQPAAAPAQQKYAQLPDGSTHAFPVDTPDEEMDAYVRQILGLPDPVHEDVKAQAFMAGVQSLNEVSQTLQAVVMTLQQMMQMMSELPRVLGTVPEAILTAAQYSAQTHESTTAKLVDIGAALVGASQAVADSNNQLAAVNAAPRIKKMVYDGDDKRPTELHETVKLR